MEKKNIGIKIAIVILSLLVIGLTGYIVYDKTLDKNNVMDNNIPNDNDVNNNIPNDNDVNNNIPNDNDVNNNITTNKENNEKLDEANFIRETRIILIDEPNCTGKSSSLMATIEANGNISIAQDGGAVEIEVGNAKYLYRVGMLACNNFKLYYITENNELYAIDNPDSTTLEQKTNKVTESKVIEFLGVESKSDGSYLKVLLESEEIKYIKYFTSPTPNNS